MKRVFHGLAVVLAVTSTGLYANTCGLKTNPCQEQASVVGAGFAGVSAAYELNKAGIDVALFEARDRIGGRVFSKVKHGIQVEEGALFVDSDHEYVFKYMDVLGLEKLDKTNPKHSGYSVDTLVLDNNGEVSPSALYERFEAIIEFLGNEPFSDNQLNRMTYKQLVQKVPNVKNQVKQDFLSYAERFIASEYGESPRDINAHIFYELMTWDKAKRVFEFDGQIGDERYRIKGGNQQIALGLAKQLPKNSVHLNHVLYSVVEQKQGSYLLEFKHLGKSHWVETQSLVLVAPIHLYQSAESEKTFKNDKINLNVAGLPKSMLDAFKSLTYGANHKLMLFFKGDVWQNESQKREILEIVHPYFHAWNAGKGTDNNKMSAVTLFISGREGKQPLTKIQQQAYAYQFIEYAGKVLPQLKASKLVDIEPAVHWPSAKFSLGSYGGAFKVGEADKYGYWIGNPQVGNLVFAGSEWSQDYYGFMNGALENGYASAQYIINRVQTQKKAASVAQSQSR